MTVSAPLEGELPKAALALAQDRWRVFPLIPGAKVPAVARGFLAATDDPAQIERWWAGCPAANIGLSIPSGIFVLDEDDREADARLSALDVHLPATVEVATPRGRHLYYSVSEEVRPGVGIVKGVDVRGVGSYVVVPPSVVEGKQYRWINPLDRDRIAPAPEELLNLLREFRRGGQAAFRKHIADNLGDLKPVLEGGRNDFLASVAGHLLRRNVSPELVPALVHGLNSERCSPPLCRDEVDAVVHSILVRELKRRTAGGSL